MREEVDHITKARLTYVTPPTEEQLNGIKSFLCKKFDLDSIELECVEDKSIGSGFVIRAGSHEFDWSQRGRVNQLRQAVNSALSGSVDITNGDLLSKIKSQLEDFDLSLIHISEPTRRS